MVLLAAQTFFRFETLRQALEERRHGGTLSFAHAAFKVAGFGLSPGDCAVAFQDVMQRPATLLERLA